MNPGDMAKKALIKAYVPDAETMSFDDAYALAKFRDEKAAEELRIAQQLSMEEENLLKKALGF